MKINEDGYISSGVYFNVAASPSSVYFWRNSSTSGVFYYVSPSTALTAVDHVGTGTCASQESPYKSEEETSGQ